MFTFWSKLKMPARVLLAVVMFGILYGVLSLTGVIGLKTMESLIPTVANLGAAPSSHVDYSVEKLDFPGTVPSPKGNTVRGLIWFWNSQTGLMLANGGATTTVGSIMEKRGVRAILTRQDDAVQMRTELLAAAKDLKENGSTDKATYVHIMGDGAPAFIETANAQLAELGPEYKLIITGIIGKSAGEDAFMVKPEMVGNPQSLKGKVISGYITDGDWNIALKYAGDNQIKNNPDTRTYDPDAMNWIAANDYLDACVKYNTGYTEERIVVKNGKPTGEKITVSADGVVTWFPGDKNIAAGKGGLVRLVSTKEYGSQMPNTMVCIGKWARDNRTVVQNYLAACYEGADQVKVYPDALIRAGQISAAVYKESNGPEITKAFKGFVMKDKQGYEVAIGGSSVCNLADAMEWFGLDQNGSNIYAATYTTFADILKQQYPKLFPKYEDPSKIIDVSFVQNIAASQSNLITKAEKSSFTENTSITNTVSSANLSIEFASGSANFTSSATKTLEQLYRSTIVADNLYITIQGHTDNVGGDGINIPLSQRRAEAVRTWLQNKNATKYPSKRFSSVEGFGSTQPVADNSSELGKQKNRRVTIVLGN